MKKMAASMKVLMGSALLAAGLVTAAPTMQAEACSHGNYGNAGGYHYYNCGVEGCTRTKQHTHYNCGVEGCTRIKQHTHYNCGVEGCTRVKAHTHYDCGVEGCTKIKEHTHANYSYYASSHHSGNGHH